MNNRSRILAVDDEETILEIYRDMLEPLGWELHTAKSYIDAINRLDERRESNHLVVPIDRADLERLVDASDRSEVLKNLYDRTVASAVDEDP